MDGIVTDTFLAKLPIHFVLRIVISFSLRCHINSCSSIRKILDREEKNDGQFMKHCARRPFVDE